MTVNSRLQDAGIRHKMFLQRHSAGVARRAHRLLEDSEQEILRSLNIDNLTELGRRRQERKLRDIRTIMHEGYGKLQQGITSDISEFAEYEANFQHDLFKRTLPVGINTTAPAPAQLLAAVRAKPFQGRLLREWWGDLETAAFRRVKSAVRIGFAEGQTTDQIVRAIRGTRRRKFADGILGQNRKSTTALVRTALNHTASVARQETFEANKSIIKEVRWVATLDGRTTLICASRDGRTYPLDSGPRPPAHINCRSTTVPVTKSWRELGLDLDEFPPGTRASMDGQVPATQTFDAFLRGQPAKFQDEFLGKSKGRLFRQGGVAVDKFVDRRGKSYTLPQLREREQAAWGEAFGDTT